MLNFMMMTTGLVEVFMWVSEFWMATSFTVWLGKEGELKVFRFAILFTSKGQYYRCMLC